MSWLSRLIGKPKSRVSIPSSIELTAELAFLQRAPSLSLLVFRGDVEAAIQTWLDNHGWELVERTTRRASFDELYAVSRETRSEGKRTQVIKATYRIAGFTVLLDPEMVVMVQDELSELCRDASTQVLGGIWERYSRTVMISEITAGGVKRS